MSTRAMNDEEFANFVRGWYGDRPQPDLEIHWDKAATKPTKLFEMTFGANDPAVRAWSIIPQEYYSRLAVFETEDGRFVGIGFESHGVMTQFGEPELAAALKVIEDAYVAECARRGKPVRRLTKR